MIDDKFKKAARVIIKAGSLPFPINDTLIELLKLLIYESELDFIMAFKRKASQTMEEIKRSSKMSEEDILNYVKSLAKKGFMFNQPNSKGVMVFRLMPLVMVGAFEYAFMKKIEFTSENKIIAELFAKYFKEVTDFIQDSYDTILQLFENMRPYDRTLPILGRTVNNEELQISVNEELKIPEEIVIPTQNVEELIEKFEDIAVGHCFCRHHKDLLGESCKQTDVRENCFTFGKSANYVAEQGFGRLLSKEEALIIMKEAENHGLVHKAFHPHSDIYKEESSVCNCCKCCCGTIDWWRTGMTAMINSTNFLSKVNESFCTGCETCAEKCPVDAVTLNNDNKAEVNQSYCIGCGICAHFCPEGAITLLEGMRKVYVPPPRLRQ